MSYQPQPPQQPPFAPVPQPQGPTSKKWPWVVAIVVAFLGGIGVGASGGETDPAVETAAEPQPTVTVEVPAEPKVAPAEKKAAAEKPAPKPKPKPKPKGPATEILGDGMYLVGKDIKPGTYRANDTGDWCYWERLKGTSGSFDDILANGNPTGAVVVTIKSSDDAFKTQGCGTWKRT